MADGGSSTSTVGVTVTSTAQVANTATGESVTFNVNNGQILQGGIAGTTLVTSSGSQSFAGPPTPQAQPNQIANAPNQMANNQPANSAYNPYANVFAPNTYANAQQAQVAANVKGQYEAGMVLSTTPEVRGKIQYFFANNNQNIDIPEGIFTVENVGQQQLLTKLGAKIETLPSNFPTAPVADNVGFNKLTYAIPAVEMAAMQGRLFYATSEQQQNATPEVYGPYFTGLVTTTPSNTEKYNEVGATSINTETLKGITIITGNEPKPDVHIAGPYSPKEAVGVVGKISGSEISGFSGSLNLFRPKPTNQGGVYVDIKGNILGAVNPENAGGVDVGASMSYNPVSDIVASVINSVKTGSIQFVEPFQTARSGGSTEINALDIALIYYPAARIAGGETQYALSSARSTLFQPEKTVFYGTQAGTTITSETPGFYKLNYQGQVFSTNAEVPTQTFYTGQSIGQRVGSGSDTEFVGFLDTKTYTFNPKPTVTSYGLDYYSVKGEPVIATGLPTQSATPNAPSIAEQRISIFDYEKPAFVKQSGIPNSEAQPSVSGVVYQNIPTNPELNAGQIGGRSVYMQNGKLGATSYTGSFQDTASIITPIEKTVPVQPEMFQKYSGIPETNAVNSELNPSVPKSVGNDYANVPSNIKTPNDIDIQNYAGKMIDEKGLKVDNIEIFDKEGIVGRYSEATDTIKLADKVDYQGNIYNVNQDLGMSASNAKHELGHAVYSRLSEQAQKDATDYIVGKIGNNEIGSNKVDAYLEIIKGKTSEARYSGSNELFENSHAQGELFAETFGTKYNPVLPKMENLANKPGDIFTPSMTASEATTIVKPTITSYGLNYYPAEPSFGLPQAIAKGQFERQMVNTQTQISGSATRIANPTDYGLNAKVTGPSTQFTGYVSSEVNMPYFNPEGYGTSPGKGGIIAGGGGAGAVSRELSGASQSAMTASLFASPAESGLTGVQGLAQFPLAGAFQNQQQGVSQSQIQTPSQVQIQMPSSSQIQMPAQSQIQMPASAQIQMPAQSQIQMPGQSQIQLPNQAQIQMPAQSQIQMPLSSQITMPAQIIVPAQVPVVAVPTGFAIPPIGGAFPFPSGLGGYGGGKEYTPKGNLRSLLGGFSIGKIKIK